MKTESGPMSSSAFRGITTYVSDSGTCSKPLDFAIGLTSVAVVYPATLTETIAMSSGVPL